MTISISGRANAADREDAMTGDAGTHVFLAQFCMETNTFSDLMTGDECFGEGTYIRSRASLTDPTGLGYNLRILRDLAEADGLVVSESVCAYPEPGGPIVRSSYEEIRDSILADLKLAGDVTMVLLVLHGAMVAEGYDDCEGDILCRVRKIAGPDVTIGIVLDPHCHLTNAMVENANLIIAMRQYPHTDFAERAKELYRLCKARADGVIRPVTAVFDCRMVGLYPTTIEPMAGYVRALEASEADDSVLSTSLIHGFPWGDTPDTGACVIVTTQADRSLAYRVAERLGHQFYAMRDALLPNMPAIAEAIHQAAELDGLTILADAADNSGGGAPGDRTDLLKAIMATGAPSAFGTIFDPEAVDACMEAGLEAQVKLRIGGKLGASSGEGLELDATVMGLDLCHSQTVFGFTSPLGASAWIRSGSTDIVLASIRSQVFGPDAFTGLGINLSNKRIVGVKSIEHFRAGFRQIADHIICVASDGALGMDFAQLRYVNKRDLQYHPRIRDPMALDTLAPLS